MPALRLLRADTEEDRQAEWLFAAKKKCSASPKEALIQRGKVPPPAASEEEAHEFTIAGGLGRRDRSDRSTRIKFYRFYSSTMFMSNSVLCFTPKLSRNLQPTGALLVLVTVFFAMCFAFCVLCQALGRG